MKIKPGLPIFFVLWLVFAAMPTFAVSEPGAAEAEPEKGPHRGRMLREGDFALELAIFETGVPPEFRVWITDAGKPINPQEVKLNIKLIRLGDVVDDINFRVQADFLRGDMEIYEPHSFVVSIKAEYQGKPYTWEYDNFEGRTLIEPAVADAMGIQTEIAGPATISQTIEAFGSITSPKVATRQIHARFEGLIKAVHVELGQTVKRGDNLLTIESNESLKSYTITAPSDGVVQSLNASAGEQSQGRELLTVMDPTQVVADLAVFPKNRAKIKIGAPVVLVVNGSDSELKGTVASIATHLNSDQSTRVRVAIDSSDQSIVAGSFVSGLIQVATYDVPLAVKRIGLQSFRDFTVVYAKVGDEYEVRMLELGRQGGEWIEVLGGLKPGTEYVTENSYVIKADIEKSGASHDH
ncbi:MAG: HlyD family efflux transporter periplasmic adaptor subunit [Sulfitobacter sp.]